MGSEAAAPAQGDSARTSSRESDGASPTTPHTPQEIAQLLSSITPPTDSPLTEHSNDLGALTENCNDLGEVPQPFRKVQTINTEKEVTKWPLNVYVSIYYDCMTQTHTHSLYSR